MDFNKLKKDIKDAKLSVVSLDFTVLDSISRTYVAKSQYCFFSAIEVSKCIASGCTQGCQISCFSGVSQR